MKEVCFERGTQLCTVVERKAALPWRKAEVPDVFTCPRVELVTPDDEDWRSIPFAIDAKVTHANEVSDRVVIPDLDSTIDLRRHEVSG